MDHKGKAVRFTDRKRPHQRLRVNCVSAAHKIHLEGILIDQSHKIQDFVSLFKIHRNFYHL